MSVTGFVVLAIAAWATYASVRTTRRIGLRRFGMAVGRLGWDLGKAALGGAALVGGAVAASAASRSDDDGAARMFTGPDRMDINDSDNYYVNWDSPLYIGDAFDKREGEV